METKTVFVVLSTGDTGALNVFSGVFATEDQAIDFIHKRVLKLGDNEDEFEIREEELQLEED